MLSDKKFTFEISLSVLNHLGRNLYRSFITILGEAISNSWDADAKNVWIYIDRDKDSFIIKDDGNGMSAGDFQDKFLKIGYSKRKGGVSKSDGGRPFIGRKGIGKLALLSCAKTISVISKQTNEQYVGGVIENSGLDDAIKNDLTPDEYPLGAWDESLFAPYTELMTTVR
jgi:HSP90 family molecular chaperone